MNIVFEEGVVCYADGDQWYPDGKGWLQTEGHSERSFAQGGFLLDYKDFQLNTSKKGDYITKSELDTEDKYNRAVEVFGLFGLFGFHRVGEFALNYEEFMNHPNGDSLVCCESLCIGIKSTHDCCERKITFNQLMAIGELKRLMAESDYSKRVTDSGCYDVNSANSNSSVSAVNRDTVCGKPKSEFVEAIERVNELESNTSKNKSLQAYEILESLDYEFDSEKGRWYRKEWL